MIGRRALTTGALASAALPRAASAQEPWKPSKPIRLIVPYGPGGSADQVARLYAERISDQIGQQIIVEDKPGASGGVGAAMVGTSAPDGYTLLLSPTAIMAITPGRCNLRRHRATLRRHTCGDRIRRRGDPWPGTRGSTGASAWPPGSRST